MAILTFTNKDWYLNNKYLIPYKYKILIKIDIWVINIYLREINIDYLVNDWLLHIHYIIKLSQLSKNKSLSLF